MENVQVLPRRLAVEVFGHSAVLAMRWRDSTAPDLVGAKRCQPTG